MIIVPNSGIMASNNVENDAFFDAPEGITSESDSASEGSEDYNTELHLDNNALESLHSNFWEGHPKSVDERRDEFIRQTGFVLERCLTAREGLDDELGNEMGIDKRTSGRLISRKEKNLIVEAMGEGEDVLWRSNHGGDFGVDQANHGGMSRRLNGVGIKRCATAQDAEILMTSTKDQDHGFESDVEGMRKVRHRRHWFKKLSFKASNMFSKERESKQPCDYREVFGPESERIHVRSHKKWSKELSAMYRLQDFPAHNGSILTMKFSHDGQHLATGGEDAMLYIWKVVEDERPSSSDVMSFNSASACLYFSVNGISDFASFLKIKEDSNVINRLKNFLQSACIMLPRKVFHIVEKPVHELCGHEGEILDISWSKEGYLLTSSDDKTVRLWQLGCNQCLRVFPHNDYVTCAQFDPLSNDHFISGSIDGIVRIWEVHGCRVADWVDFKEIVTAICYRPDGKGGIVGSMVGNFSFFEITDDCPRGHILSMQGKEKLAGKRINGFQFSPTDPSVVLVSSADSQVRLLRDSDLICKLRGSLTDMKDGGSSILASFTADGKHIISATDDSDVYMWNHPGNDIIPNTKAKTIWTCEGFSSPNALIAVPWQGFKCTLSESEETSSTAEAYSKTSLNPLQFDENGGLESSLMGSESQPREGVPKMSPTVVLPTAGKIDYELLKVVCESILTGAHMLGLVIVTGGKDGRIKTFHNYGLPIRSSKGNASLKKLSSYKCPNVFR